MKNDKPLFTNIHDMETLVFKEVKHLEDCVPVADVI
jgi:hypothetical protein